MKLGVTGHQSMPQVARERLEEAVLEIVDVERTVEVCSSLAAGADQLVADRVLRAGGTLDAVLPCRDYSDAFDSSDDQAELRRLLEQARGVSMLPFREPSEEAFLAAGIVVVERSELLLAAWDGKPAEGLGGTADIVAYARDRQIPVRVVWPAGVQR